jgi:hypothetical protein
MHWLWRFSILFTFISWTLFSPAETVRTISTTRVQLADIMTAPSNELGAVDLGPAPPPGSTRLIARSEILKRLSAAGHSGKGLTLPHSVRVKSASKTLSTDELSALARPVILGQLKPGVSLSKLRVTRAVVVSPGAVVGSVKLPRLPKRVGPFQTTAILSFEHDGQLTANVPLSITLEVSEQATRSLVEKGNMVALVIERGAARITAKGVALSDSDLGQVAQFKVLKTRKLVRSRVVSRHQAKVVAE